MEINVTAPLFVPADRPERVQKARERGARTVIIDLEDAIPLPEKPRARELLRGAITTLFPGGSHVVRVNAASAGGLLDEDIEALVPVLPHIDGVILAKANSADEVGYLHRRLRAEGHEIPIIPTIETAIAVRDSHEIAAAPGVLRLLFGSADLSAQLGVTPSAAGHELATARSLVVLASAASEIGAPIDGPHLNLRDLDGLAVSTRHAIDLGFAGKIVLHPDQLPVVTEAFRPTDAEAAWAHTVLAAWETALADGVGVAQLEDGTFIDPPIAARARLILQRSEG